jgi:catechol 2,3-dioxygenase-like lactoylglutathione lyase family enzyme
MAWSSNSARAIVPILRMYDMSATRRFYLEYLGFSEVHQTEDDDGPVYLIVSLGPVRLHLSSHHGDGTPGTAVLIVTGELDALHATLAAKGYPYMNPGIDAAPGGGRQIVVLDPAGNGIRFYEPG